MTEPPVYHLSLADGRNLGYTDIGSGENGTWIHCHGIPGSRHELMHLAGKLEEAGIRVVVPDRPGYGNSTPHPDFCFTSHSDDLRQLADHLQLARLALSGFSGGGVFAMATAHDLGKRASRLTIAATPAVPLMVNPFEHASELTANAWRAALDNTEVLASQLQALTASSDALSAALLDAAGEDERRYLSSKPVYQDFLTSLRMTLNQGPAAAANVLARDSFLIASQWPFDLKNLDIPTLILHGAADNLVFEQHQTALLKCLPEAQPRLIAGVGHYDLLPSIWD